MAHTRRTTSCASTSQTADSVLICKVCGDFADGQHFGADSCRACAAFFRRTISRKLKYICRFDGDCLIAKSYRSLCRACRFDKCLEKGMNASAVRSECVEIARPPKAAPGRVKGAASAAPAQPADEALPAPVPLHAAAFDAANVYVWENHHHPEPHEQPPRRHRPDDSTASSLASTSSMSSASSWPRSPNDLTDEPPRLVTSGSNAAAPIVIHDIVEVKGADYVLDHHALPVTHPTLTKMLLAYEGMQKRRDDHFHRTNHSDGVTYRMYNRTNRLDLLDFYQMTQAELPHIAEFLNLCDGYKELPHHDKVEIFRHFWIYFIILERNFDTYRVLGANLEDRQIVFANGDIVDVFNCEYDVSKITDVPLDDIKRLIHPWYRLSAEELIQPVKKLGPSDVEMMFCLGYMLWHFPSELGCKLSPTTATKAEAMVNQLYNELNAYYMHMVSVDNVVRRISELMSFVSSTERIVMYRKEDMILARTFLAFKVDIYMESVFHKD